MEEAEITREQLIRELGAYERCTLETVTTHRLKEFNNPLTVALGYTISPLAGRQTVPPAAISQQTMTAGMPRNSRSNL